MGMFGLGESKEVDKDYKEEELEVNYSASIPKEEVSEEDIIKKVKENKEERELKEALEKQEKAEKEVERALLESAIGNYVEREDVTDIGFNGTTLYVQDSKGLHKIENSGVTSEDIQELAKKVSNEVNKNFTNTTPILDTAIGRFRLNFMHRSISPFGTTMALRVSKPMLAIKDPTTLGNGSLIKLLNLCMKIGENSIISGETGSGKTELQKYLVGFIPDDKKITLMEDTPDSHLKRIYPEKDINSWVTKEGGDDGEGRVTFVELLKAALRNNPEWAIISETRGEEAKNMIDVAQTDHSVITTLHASGAPLIPSRIISMVSQGSKGFNELMLGKDIVDVINIGIHMKLDRSTGKMNRFIREVVEFTDYDSTGAKYNYLYRVTNEYDEDTGKYNTIIETGAVSERFVEKLKLNRLYHHLPVYHHPDCYDSEGRFIVSKAKEIYEKTQKALAKERGEEEEVSKEFKLDETIRLEIKNEKSGNNNNKNKGRGKKRR